MSKLDDYIREIHSEQYLGTDDMMVDDYNDWIVCQDIDDIIKWAEVWHKSEEVKLLEECLLKHKKHIENQKGANSPPLGLEYFVEEAIKETKKCNA